MMEWKEELQQHTKEAEKIVQGYLPEETGHQKLLIEASSWWKASSPDDYAGKL